MFYETKNTTNDDSDHVLPVQLSQPIRSMHETKIQSALEIGEPIPYDSEEYFDLYLITEMYQQYPVQYFCDKKKRWRNGTKL